METSYGILENIFGQHVYLPDAENVVYVHQSNTGVGLKYQFNKQTCILHIISKKEFYVNGYNVVYTLNILARRDFLLNKILKL